MTCQSVITHTNPGHDLGSPLPARNLASSDSSASEKAEDTGDRHSGFSHHLRSTSVHPGALGGFICALDDAVSDYDSAYDYASASSFEFQKGQRASIKSLVAPCLNKAVPSKWDDAEKWLVSQSSNETSYRGRTKSGPLFGYHLPGETRRSPHEWHLQPFSMKSGCDSQLTSSVSSGGDTLPTVQGNGQHQNVKFVTAPSDQGFEIPGERTKKMDVVKVPSIGPNFAFIPALASPQKGGFYKCYSPVDEPVDMKEVSIAHEGSFKALPSKLTLRTRKPTSDSLASVAPYASPAPPIRSVSMRDMGTEMTPITSQEPSRTGTPLCATTPTLHSPVSSPPLTPRQISPMAISPLRTSESTCAINSDGKLLQSMDAEGGREVQVIGAHLAGKLTMLPWASKEEEDGDSSKLLKNTDLEEVKKNVLETRAVAWEEAEQSKHLARFKREEAKILAWENHEKAKAEAKMRRIEVKLEKTRANAHEGLMKKLTSARRKAEELLAVAEARRCKQASKSAQRADCIRRTGRLPSSSLFSCGLCR